jgi:predicted SAM-dependent methyltransferase
MSEQTEKKYVQYGCGLSAPSTWMNFDASPSLRIQKIPLFGQLMKSRLNVIFPPNVMYGDIIKGLPVEKNSCDAVFCSHTLEHLSLMDFRTALNNTFAIMKPGGLFRCIVPDLESAGRKYISDLEDNPEQASILFLEEVLLGVRQRPRKLKGFVSSFYGNSHHLWMWDQHSLKGELRSAGFKNIRTAVYNDSREKMFGHVEDKSRFIHSVCLECEK